MGPNVVAEANRAISSFTSSKRKDSHTARILIVCDDDLKSERLNAALLEAGFIADRVKNMTEGCKSARSGQFQVLISVPELIDGSWRRLADIATHYDLGFVVLLMATRSDLQPRDEALEDEPFDIFDVAHELPKVAEFTRRALWAAYLKGGGPSPEAAISPKAA